MRRSDGRPLKSIGTFVKMIPYIMTRRSDAQVFFKQTIDMEKIDHYLREKRELGQSINYLHFFISIYVRLIALRPQLNRFVMNNKLYARDGIFISMAVKRSLHDEAEETTVKFAFTGREDIFEIARIVEEKISECTATAGPNNVDRITALIMTMPVKKALVGMLKFMDRYNLLPRAALGQTKKIPVVENDAVVIRRCCEVGYTLDERVCDGLYFANSLKLIKKFLEDPYLLETCLLEKVKDVK